MKIRIINMDERIKTPKEKRSWMDKILLSCLLVVQIFFNTLLPFTLGFFYHQTNSHIFFVFMLLSLFFNIQIEYKTDGEIKIKVLRNV